MMLAGLSSVWKEGCCLYARDDQVAKVRSDEDELASIGKIKGDKKRWNGKEVICSRLKNIRCAWISGVGDWGRVGVFGGRGRIVLRVGHVVAYRV